jgi:CheY-like chemotaxis protein
MAIKDGIDATREIRFWEGSKRGTGEHLPIVALTGSTSPDVEQECLAAGMVSSCNCTHFVYTFQKFCACLLFSTCQLELVRCFKSCSNCTHSIHITKCMCLLYCAQQVTCSLCTAFAHKLLLCTHYCNTNRTPS